MNHTYFMNIAKDEAKKSLSRNGIPIGSVLVVDNKVVGKGHNQRIQKGSPILHGEMDALENAGRLNVHQYMKATIYTTLSPCSMCSGAILLYKIPRVVVGENVTFMGEEDLLRKNGVEVIVLNDSECKSLMNEFITRFPNEWAEDIGE